MSDETRKTWQEVNELTIGGGCVIHDNDADKAIDFAVQDQQKNGTRAHLITALPAEGEDYPFLALIDGVLYLLIKAEHQPGDDFAAHEAATAPLADKRDSIA